MGKFHKESTHNSLDQYYTKADVAKRCIDSLGDLSQYDYIIEPSAGDGAFFNQIHHNNKVGIDIQPATKGVKRCNWFDFTIDTTYQNVCVIGNPPFGRDNELSTQFILYALQFQNVTTVAFILPNTYKKYTRQKFIPLNWRISDIISIEDNAFYFQNNEIHIPCSFFVLSKSKGEDLRFHPEQYKESVHFTFGTKNDFDLFVFGASPAKTTKIPTSNNRGYYLKSKIPVEQLIRNISTIKWQGNSSASGGVFWLTKSELVHLYDSAMGYTSIAEPTSSNHHSLFESTF